MKNSTVEFYVNPLEGADHGLKWVKSKIGNDAKIN